MKIALLFGLSFCLAVTVQAQSIKGKLVDPADSKPLAGATLKLTSLKDSTLKFNTISDTKGFFEFKNLPSASDSFLLQVTFLGYENFKQVVVAKDAAIDLGTVSIPKTVKQLGEVVVVINTPATTQKGDTTQFSASQFKVNPDATTEDLIKKMPGITVDKDGTVTAQGDQVKKVTVDGRDFFGDDATAALRNLPSAIVDKIQVFDRLSDQAQFTGFDDGNSVKAINIVTKSGIKNGQFGRIYAGYGTNDTYSAGGNVSFFKGDRRISLVGNFNNINQQNFASQDLLGVTSSGGRGFGGGNFGGGNRGGGGGGFRGGGGFGGFGGGNNFTVGQQSGISKTNAFGINFGDKWGKKVDVTGSYFFNNSNNNNDQLLRSQTLFNDSIQYTDQNSFSNSKNFNHRINMRIEYRIDSSNSFIISPSLNFQNNKSISDAMSQTYYGANDTLNTADNNTSTSRNGYNLRNNILFRHSFASKRGRTLSVNLNTTFNKNDGESYVTSHYRFFNNPFPPTDSLQDQYTLNPTNGYSINSNISYTEPIGKKGQLQINYSPSYSKSKADQQTYSFDQLGGKYSKFDTTLSNKFDNTTTTHNGGVTYRLGQSRDNQFSVGVSFQYSNLQSDRIFPTSTQVNQSFTTILPNLMWRKKISAHSNFNLFYRENTNFPNVTQLQDVVNISDPLRVSSGNPELKQSSTHFLSGRYIFTNTRKSQSFFANVFVQMAKDYISNATFSPSADSTIQQGIVLKRGSQLTKPVNLDGYKSLRSFFTYSMPLKFIKSNINVSTGFIYSKLPGLINNEKTFTNSYAFNNGVVIASNISEYVDFNLSYNVSFNNAKSTSQSQADNKYVNQSAGIQFNLLSKNGWFVQNDISNQSYSGLSQGLNQSYWLWNAAVGKKFLKNKAGELKLSVFDLLKQNQSITRTVSENYIEDVQSKVLTQYFMLTFTYSLKNFGKANMNNNFQRGDRERGFQRF